MLRFAISFIFLISSLSISGQCNAQAHFRLDGNASDSSGFGNHGTIYGGAISTIDRFGQANGAMYFDGVNDYINTFSTYDYAFRTVSVWFYPERATGINQVLAHDDITLTYGAFGFRITNGRLDANSAGNSAVAIPNINLNQWYHLVLVSRPDSGFCYINGTQVIAAASSSNGSISGAYDKLVLGVGRQRNINYYKGAIDDLKIYNCAFTSTQVDSLFNDSSANITPSNCIIGDYRLDGNAIDSSVFANHGSIFGGATAALDRFNQINGAMYFDGTDDYLNTFTTYDIPYRTVSIWIYPERSTGGNNILVQDDAALNFGSFEYRILNGNLLGNSAGNSAQVLTNINLNQWYHLALVSRPDSGFCYINGVQVNAEASTSNGSVSNSYDKLLLGVGRQRNTNFYKGSIDDLMIFNCDFDPQKIDSLFIAQSPFPPLDTFSLDTILCLGDSLYFDLDGSSSISYFWDNGSTDTLRTITNPGIYTLRHTRGGDTLIDTIRLSFTTPYIPTSLDTSFCSGDSLNVDFSTLSADSLVWFDGDTSRQRTFNTVGTYAFTVYQEACGTASDSIRLSIDTLLMAQSIDSSSCQDTLRIGRGETLLNYQWSTGQSSSDILVNASGIYTVQVSGPCNTVIDTFRVELPKNLPSQISPDTLTICAINDSAQVGINIDPAFTFSWSNGATSAMQWIKVAGDYSLEIFNNCDTVEFKYTIQYKDIFEPESIPDTSLCAESVLVFDLNYPEAESVSVNGQTMFGNLLTVNEAGNYRIEYEVECGLAIDSFAVEFIRCECDFTMPDAFTPNGDGLNDRFRIDNECEDLQHSIQIFNRWGVLVFENQSSTDYWDGTHNGNAVSGGVFIYKMDYSGMINGRFYEGFKQGTIKVIR